MDKEEVMSNNLDSDFNIAELDIVLDTADGMLLINEEESTKNLLESDLENKKRRLVSTSSNAEDSEDIDEDSDRIMESNHRPRRLRLTSINRSVEDDEFNKMYRIRVKGTKWTSIERVSLLLGLKKYGLLDLKNICEVVKTKSEDDIKKFIQAALKSTRCTMKYAAKKKQSFTKSKKPDPLLMIDSWLDEIESLRLHSKSSEMSIFNSILPKAILCIAKYGNHPNPADCNGINYREAYEYLHSMLSCIPGKTLSAETNALILTSISKTNAQFRDRNQQHIMDHIQEHKNDLPDGTTYSKSRSVRDEFFLASNHLGAVKALMSLPGFNPLNLTLDLLKEPKK